MNLKGMALFWLAFLTCGPRTAWQMRRETRKEMARWGAVYPERFPTEDEIKRLVRHIHHYKITHEGAYPPEEELDAIIQRVVTLS